MNTFFASSPLEQFETYSIISLSGLGLNLSLTNLGFYVIVAVAVLFFSHVLALNAHRVVPSRWSIGFESAYTTIHTQVKEQIGSANEQYIPFIYSLFFFILLGNLFGNVPYSFAFFSSAVVAMGFSVMIFISVTILAVYRHGLHFLSYFVPAGTPGPLVPLLIIIELISYVARAFSLGIRIFANLVAGHALLNILSGMLYGIMTSGFIMAVVSVLPLAIFTALIGLEIAVSFIQAFVMTVLTMSYISDAEHLH